MHSNARRRRKVVAGFAAIGATLALTMLTVGPVQAVHDTGAFELDGNATNQAVAGDDWDNVCHQVSPTSCPSPTTNTSGATAVDWVSEPNGNASIFTGGGSKDPIDVNQWAWKDAGGLPDKDNLTHGFAARYSSSSGELLYFGSDRLDNSGDAQQGFWFFQNPIALGTAPLGGGTSFTGVHAAGDLLVISDFSNGGTTSIIKVFKWDPTCARTAGTCADKNLRSLASSDNASCSSATAGDAFCGTVNTLNGTAAPWPYTDKSGNHSYLQGEFYEGGVNLTALGLGDQCFSSVASETRSSTSTTATLKDFVLGGFGNCGSTITTTASLSAPASIGTGSVSVSDSATVGVTGVSTWSGTVQFSLRGPIVTGTTPPSSTIGTPVPVSSTNPTVSSINAAVTSAGRYCWSAHFASGTTNVPDGDDLGIDDADHHECFTINPVTPTLTTSAGADVVLGSPVTDTAMLSGTSNQPGTPAINPTTPGANAGGSISFTLVKNDCTTPAAGPETQPQTRTVDGNGSYGPVSFTPDAIGTYHWIATYTPASGDPNNLGSTHNGDCSDTGETVVVTSVKSSLSSVQSFIPNDAVTVSAPAGGPLLGSVKFELFESPDCSGTAVYTPANVAVSGSSPQTVKTSNTTISTTATNVSWRLTYTSNNPAQDSIPASCQEHSVLTITNGQSVSSP